MLAMFGLFMAIAYNAPWWVWLIGFVCFVFNGAFSRALNRF